MATRRMKNYDLENAYQILYKLSNGVSTSNTYWTTSREFKADKLVSVAGFEPATSCSQSRRNEPDYPTPSKIGGLKG